MLSVDGAMQVVQDPTPESICLDGTVWEGKITFPGDKNDWGDPVEYRECQFEVIDEQQAKHG